MCDDSDQEISELDIENRTWNKLQRTMKLFGFREGAVKGKNLTLQDGFNLGYFDGFKLGEYLGTCKGIINCESELGLKTNNKSHVEEILNKFSSQSCSMCLVEKNTKILPSNYSPFENVRDLASMQQGHSNKIMQSMEQSNLEPYDNKG